MFAIFWNSDLWKKAGNDLDTLEDDLAVSKKTQYSLWTLQGDAYWF